MPRKVGDKMLFSGGAEHTPAVTVDRFRDPGSMHSGEITFKIEQGMGHHIFLSPGTMRAILKWYEEGEKETRAGMTPAQLEAYRNGEDGE